MSSILESIVFTSPNKTILYKTIHMQQTITLKYIEQIIECEYHRVLRNNSGCFVSNGTMGVALFMIWYGKNFNKVKYVEDGLSIIGVKCTHLTSNDSLDVHKGQVGIALGILWLSLSGIIQMPISGVLSHIDDNIFKKVSRISDYSLNKNLDQLLDVACYVALRLKYRSCTAMDDKIYSRFLSMLINYIYPDFYKMLQEEVYPGGYSYRLPRFIYLIQASFGNNFDNRLIRIIEEVQPLVLAQFPYMTANRLALANSIRLLAHTQHLCYRWGKHATMLVESIGVEELEEEYKTNQMSLYDGMGWFALQLLILRKLRCNVKIEAWDYVRSRLKRTSYIQVSHKELCEHNFVGLYGILELFFVELNLNKDKYD